MKNKVKLKTKGEMVLFPVILMKDTFQKTLAKAFNTVRTSCPYYSAKVLVYRTFNNVYKKPVTSGSQCSYPEFIKVPGENCTIEKCPYLHLSPQED